MTETNKNSSEKLSVTSTKTLTLKRGGVEQGVVRQSFSHGRSKAVVVEKVKRRAGPGEAKPEPPAPAERSATAAPKRAVTPARAPSSTPAAAPAKPSGVVLRTLTEEERSARAHALADARLREAVRGRVRFAADEDQFARELGVRQRPREKTRITPRRLTPEEHQQVGARAHFGERREE